MLDLSPLRLKFKSVFGDASVMATWFSMLLHSSTVCVLTGVSANFSTLAGLMLDSIAARLKVELPSPMRADILSGFANLPAHNDIKPALSQLRSAGYRTVAFSNSSSDLIRTQISNAGLDTYFDAVVSVEGCDSFKPAPKAYQFVAEKIQRPIESLRLVATHDWDTHGALTAGMQAAYIDRSGALYHDLYRRPDIVGVTMVSVVEQIIAVNS